MILTSKETLEAAKLFMRRGVFASADAPACHAFIESYRIRNRLTTVTMGGRAVAAALWSFDGYTLHVEEVACDFPEGMALLLKKAVATQCDLPLHITGERNGRPFRQPFLKFLQRLLP